MEFHIGQTINERLKSLGMSKSEFARRISKARQNINDILNRKSIDTDLLLTISIALQHDFFQYYIIALNEEVKISEPTSEYARLQEKYNKCEKALLVAQKDLDRCTTETKLLKEIVDLLKQQNEQYRNMQAKNSNN